MYRALVSILPLFLFNFPWWAQTGMAATNPLWPPAADGTEAEPKSEAAGSRQDVNLLEEGGSNMPGVEATAGFSVVKELFYTQKTFRCSSKKFIEMWSSQQRRCQGIRVCNAYGTGIIDHVSGSHLLWMPGSIQKKRGQTSRLGRPMAPSRNRPKIIGFLLQVVC